MISESYVPSKYYCDMRALARGRLELVRARSARTNRIHAILYKYPHKPEDISAINIYPILDDYVEFYNERRIHFSLDIDIYETPLMAFYHKQATEDTREQNPDWMEVDING